MKFFIILYYYYIVIYLYVAFILSLYTVVYLSICPGKPATRWCIGMRLRVSSLAYLLVVCFLIAPIFSPCVYASVVYGPETFVKSGSDDAAFGSYIDLINGSGAINLSDVQNPYKLFIRKNSGDESADNMSLLLNGGEIAVNQELLNALLSRNVSLNGNNTLEFFINNSRQYSYTMWVENDSPCIQILTPRTDTESDCTSFLSGLVQDLNMTTSSPIVNGASTHTVTLGPKTVTVNHNGAISTCETQGGYFSTGINLTATNNITVSFTDATGTERTSNLLLDGDYLNQSEESALGFDPLNPDSDSSLTPDNEANNGIPDGLELFGGDANNTLPVFIKSRIGANPFLGDSDGDGLSDYFEVMKLIPFTSATSTDTDNDGIPDGSEDLDGDDLTNLQEQAYGTNPLVADTDKDGLKDGEEIAFGSNPLLKDTDTDGLFDDSELRLGTLVNNPDSDGDGLQDGFEIYTSLKTNAELNVAVSLTGVGDVAKNASVFNESSPFFLDNPSRISPIVKVGTGCFNSSWISFTLNQSNLTGQGFNVSPSKMVVCYYNETIGYFTPLDTLVEIDSSGSSEMYDVSADIYSPGVYGCFNATNFSEVFRKVVELNYGTRNVTNSINVSLNGNVNVTTVYLGQQSAVSDNGLQYFELSEGDTSSVSLFSAPRQLTIGPGLPGYSFVKQHSVIGSTDGVLSDYPVQFIVHRGGGSDIGRDVYLNNQSLSWPNDFRFTDADDSQLSYWIESSDNSTATVWVKVISIPASPGYAVLKLYYGQVGDPGASNGFSTFQFFDDFNNGSTINTQWNNGYDRNLVRQTNGIITITSNYAAHSITANTNMFGPGNSVRFKAQTSASNTEFVAGLESYDQRNRVQFYGQYQSNNIVGRSVSNGQWSITGTLTNSKNSWHIYESKWSTGKINFDLDNSNLATVTSNVPNIVAPRPILGPWNVGSLIVDWYVVRKYTLHEPTHSTWGGGSTYEVLPNPSPTDFNLDTDGDGLPDHVEEQGFLDDKQVRHYTNKSSIDTDGDGLEDGEEIAYASIADFNSGNYQIISYPDNDDSDCDLLDDYEESVYYNTEPLLKDSDSDLLDDGLEISIWTDPLSKDTDEDTFDDYFEYCHRETNSDTTQFNPLVKDLSLEDREHEFRLGYTNGEWGLESHDNMYYLSGYMVAGITPLWGDATDFSDLFASMCHLDGYSFIINVVVVIFDIVSYAALLSIEIPFIGLIVASEGYAANLISSAMARLAKFYLKHPKMIGPILTVAMKLLKDTPVADQIAWIKIVLDTDKTVIDSLRGVHHVSDDTLIDWCKKGADIKHANDLMNNGATKEEIQYVINQFGTDAPTSFQKVKTIATNINTGKITWLNEKRWAHIIERHITGISKNKITKKGTSFWPTGKVVRTQPYLETPYKMDESAVQDMVTRSIEGAQQRIIQNNGNILYRWTLSSEENGIREIETVTTAGGEIVTSYPTRGSEVKWFSDKIGIELPVVL